jgi:flagellar basal-body rod modification protein FlgD
VTSVPTVNSPSAIDSEAASAAATTADNTTGSSSLSNPNTFLQLLVSELQNQNPLNPTDPESYLEQTAEFTMVQQLDSVSSEMTSVLAASQQSAATSYIGRQIVGTSSTGSPVSGVVTGVDLSTSTPQLQVGSDSVPIGNVTSVTAASSNDGSDGASSDSTNPAATPSTTPAGSSTTPTAGTTPTPTGTTPTPTGTTPTGTTPTGTTDPTPISNPTSTPSA